MRVRFPVFPCFRVSVFPCVRVRACSCAYVWRPPLTCVRIYVFDTYLGTRTSSTMPQKKVGVCFQDPSTPGVSISVCADSTCTLSSLLLLFLLLSPRSPPPSTASQRLDNPLTSMGGLSEDIVRCLTKRDTNRNVQTLLLSSPSLPLALRHLSHLAAHLRALVLKCVHYNDVCSALVQCRHLN